MRITNGMMVTNMLRDITRNQERMDALNKNLATGKKFLKPSDDPLGVSKSLRLNTDISTINQFKRNVEDSQSWLSSTETATDNIVDILQRTRELTVQCANGSNSVNERDAMAKEIEQLKEQLIHIGNTSNAGSYLFSGFKTDKPLLKSDGTYDLGGEDLNSLEVMNVNLGIGDQFGLNFVGQRIFGVMKDTKDLDSPISTGSFDYNIQGSKSLTTFPVTVSTTPALQVAYGDAPQVNYNLNIPNTPTYNTPTELAAAINQQLASDPALGDIKNHVSASVANGQLTFNSDKPFSLDGTNPLYAGLIAQIGMTGKETAIKEEYSLQGGFLNLGTTPLNVVAGANDTFSLTYGTDAPIDITIAGGVYSTVDDLAVAIQDGISASTLGAGAKIVVTVKNGQLTFNSEKPLAMKESTTNPLLLKDMGLTTGKVSAAKDNSVKSGQETQLIGVLKQLITDMKSGDQIAISTALKRLDIHLNNINAVRAEIGVKTNRLELTSNRIEDDTLNLKTLLSQNEDADMAEVIMNLKMDENVYKSSLEGGAKIIQPTLLDFLR